MTKWNCLELQEFLSSNPKMRLSQFSDESIIIEGEYDVHAKMDGYKLIQCCYQLKIIFPKEYPKAIPTVIEITNIIPKSSKYHKYNDGSFCLGSDIKLKLILFESATISNFFKDIVDPYLYSISYKLRYDEYPNGDLDHGEEGLIDDYEQVFRVSGKVSVLRVLHALGKRKRVANKLPCGCGCGDRLGKCEYRFSIEKWRHLDRRRWFRNHLATSFTPIKKTKKKKNKIKSP